MTRVWVSSDGPYNEHLVREVGSWYLALAAAGVLTLVRRDHASRWILASAWTVFGMLHLGYHLAHLNKLASAVDRVGEVVALGGSAVLALLVFTPTSTAPMASTEGPR